MRVVVLRWGHRIPRDRRVTTHVALTARAFGAEGMILADVEDEAVERSIRQVTRLWGGSFWVKSGIPWREAVREWRSMGGLTVHLTVYGLPLTRELAEKIKRENRPVMVMVGSQKVPREFFSPKVSDYNVAVGGQPHSEVSSLAIFLDRILDEAWLTLKFDDAKLRVVPQERGKKVLRVKV
ncbi:tRNA (cytidine(56)-2'-O)-methyltransferase [Candidatus Bathyarchaeota archaeon]|nr:MAG: tRNA (cytidine(56)-2'-O)-methyltransferase [Candidatus Bathyarchaeota archaeon]